MLPQSVTAAIVALPFSDIIHFIINRNLIIIVVIIRGHYSNNLISTESSVHCTIVHIIIVITIIAIIKPYIHFVFRSSVD